MPGILAGIILAVGRIVGETAALMYTAGTAANVPSSIMGSGRTLAVHERDGQAIQSLYQ